MNHFAIIICLACWLPLAASETEPSLIEYIPDGVTPIAEQRALVLDAAAMVGNCRVGYDEAGNVIALHLSMHGSDRPYPRKHDITEEQHAALKERPGIDIQTFIALGALPELKALGMRGAERLTDDAFAVLQNWPDLEAFRIEGRYRGEPDPQKTSAYMLHLNGLTELRWLEFKHGPGPEPTFVHRLDGFPKLERLELDHSAAQSECVTFLQGCPELKDFELHRTEISNDEIGQIVDACPKLERFDLKATGKQTFDAACLAHMPRLPDLRAFTFNRWSDEAIFWDDGVEHLIDVPSLKSIGGAWDHPVIQKLRASRSDIQEMDGRDYAVTFPLYDQVLYR